MDENTIQGIICIIVGIVFIVAAFLYIQRKNKGTTRMTRTLDEFERYDNQMEQFRKSNKK